MSRSFRTRPKDILAWERMPRDRQGKIIFPRIVIRKPREGDIHPLSRQDIAIAYKKLPLEYFYGLKEIELRARKGEIGEPFGKYSPYAKKIILYSAPPSCWVFEKAPDSYLDHLENCCAQVTRKDGEAIIEWDKLSLWFFFLNVLFHELGHHYVHQYKCKQKPPLDVYLNEWYAELQVSRIQKRVFRKSSD